MKTQLQFCIYDEYDTCKYTNFEVNTEWLESIIDMPLSDFLNEYTINGRAHIKSSIEIENGSIQCNNQSFKYDDCETISKFESGKNWLYNNRCKTCEHRNRNCQYL